MKFIKIMKKLFSIAKFLIFIGILGYLLLCALIIEESNTPAVQNADVAIILGAAVYGERPSPVFEERIRHAIHLYQTQKVKKLIFTGGTPKEGYGTEAEVAMRWAIKQGIPKEDILVDPISRNTWENLQNAAAIMQQHHWHRCIIVSDPYHMARVRLMTHRMPFEIQLSATPTSRFNQASFKTKWKFISQEVASILFYVFQSVRHFFK